jgi:hypothetical protein
MIPREQAKRLCRRRRQLFRSGSSHGRCAVYNALPELHHNLTDLDIHADFAAVMQTFAVVVEDLSEVVNAEVGDAFVQLFWVVT